MGSATTSIITNEFGARPNLVHRAIAQHKSRIEQQLPDASGYHGFAFGRITMVWIQPARNSCGTPTPKQSPRFGLNSAEWTYESKLKPMSGEPSESA